MVVFCRRFDKEDGRSGMQTRAVAGKTITESRMQKRRAEVGFNQRRAIPKRISRVGLLPNAGRKQESLRLKG